MHQPLLFINRYILPGRYLFNGLISIFILSTCIGALTGPVIAAESYTIKINSNLEFDFTYQVPVKDTSNTLLLIIPSEHGLQTAEKELVNILPQYGIEVWASNLLESYFLPYSDSNMERIPAADIQQLIIKLQATTNKNIIILSTGRGTIPVLRALASWPGKVSPAYMTGLILMHPKLFSQTPEPGMAAEVMPSVKKTNQLIYFIQPSQSPFWWSRNITVNSLQQSGSDVFIHPLKNIRNRYHFRADATPTEQRLAEQYPRLIYNAITQLTHYPAKIRNLTPPLKPDNLVSSVKTSRSLATYKGTPTPPALSLALFNNPQQKYALHADKGKVLLVNFWASWCPPCVHEMPSMQALDKLLNKNTADKFKILAVNMAEDKQTISAFLKSKVSVDFTILLDSDGTALQQWKIFAFPTSFVLDKKGTIRYAIYGGIDWLEPDVVAKIQHLIDE